MKKKIICVLLSAVFAAVGFGCSGGDAKVSFDEKMPWDVQETCTYDVKNRILPTLSNSHITIATKRRALTKRAE